MKSSKVIEEVKLNEIHPYLGNLGEMNFVLYWRIKGKNEIIEVLSAKRQICLHFAKILAFLYKRENKYDRDLYGEE